MRVITIAVISAALFCLAGHLSHIGGTIPAGSVEPISLRSESVESEDNVDSLSLRADTGIDANSPPHLIIDKSISTDEIWQRYDDRGPKNATVFLEISGAGNPAINFNSQDVIFTIDCSMSMNLADPDYLRRDAAKNYVEKLIAPDRAAVIKFSDSAELVGSHHLSTDYEQVMEDLNEIDNQGQTNFTDAVQLTNREFIDYGEENKSRINILLTDGKPEPSSTNITMEVLNESIENNITIYTIGLYEFGSSTRIDEDLLRWMAKKTGGEYFVAKTPNDLVAIYEKIAMRFRNYTAGYDPDIRDSEPMLRDVLRNGFYVDENSFTRYPDVIYKTNDNLTRMEWNISNVTIGEKIFISYNISSSLQDNNISIHPQQTARVLYNVGDDEHIKFFSTVTLAVKSSKPPINLIIPPGPPPIPGPPPPPPPPPGGYPIMVPSPASPTVIPLSAPAGLPTAATPTVFPVEYFIAGFVGLGIIERLKLKKRLISRQKVAVGT